MVARRALPAFYDEAERLLALVLRQRFPEDDGVLLRDAFRLNRAAFRVPECFEDVEIETDHNVGAIYEGVVGGAETPLRRAPHRYRVRRTGTVWLSLAAWATDVVLQVYQRGQYLYPFEQVEPAVLNASAAKAPVLIDLSA
jgi:hypothetical protein